MEIKDYLKDFKIEKQKTSERAELLKEIFSIYTSKQQEHHRKKANWKRYVQWLKKNRTPESKENQTKFKKVKTKDGGFIKTHNIKSFCFLLSHLKTKDLYYVLSVGKDMENRNENFSAWIMSNNK